MNVRIRHARLYLLILVSTACAPLQVPLPPASEPPIPLSEPYIASRQSPELLEKNLLDTTPLRATPPAQLPDEWAPFVDLTFKVSGPLAFRPAAKTRYAVTNGKFAPFEHFEDVPALVADINEKHPEKETATKEKINYKSDRTPPEMRNVVVRGYLRTL